MSRSSVAGRPGARPPRPPGARAARSLVLDAARRATRSSRSTPARPSSSARRPGCSTSTPHEIVVATGAAEIQPVCPGNDLAGLVTARAAERAACRGRRPRRGRGGRGPPDGVSRLRSVPGRLVRFEGDERAGARGRHGGPGDRRRDDARRPTRSSSVSAGRRGTCWRGWPATCPIRRGRACGRGAAAPAAPDRRRRLPLHGHHRRRPRRGLGAGFTELELLKRASRAGSGRARAAPACRTFARGSPPGPGRCRSRSRRDRRRARSPSPRPPPTRTSTSSAGRRSTTSTSRSAARMDRFGGWWRPWHYGDAIAEYWAVREGVSIGDVSTLGKLVVSGPDVVESARAALSLPRRRHQARPVALRAPAQRARPRHGRRDDPARVRDPVRALVHVRWRGERRDVGARLDRDLGPPRPRPGPDDVARRDQRHRARSRRRSSRRAGLADPPRFLGHVHADVAGVPCHVMRLSFTGEAAFELHHPVDRSVELWRALMDARRGPRRSGRTASRRCSGSGSRRATSSSGWTPSSTRRRAGSGWTGRSGWRSPGSSAGRRSSGPRSCADQRRWVGFTMDGPAPTEGAPILAGGEVVGNVTGSWHSPLLGRALMLGWQRRTPFRDRVEIDGREAVVTPDPVLRPGGPSCARLSRSAGCAWSADPAALDARALAGRRGHGPAGRP